MNLRGSCPALLAAIVLMAGQTRAAGKEKDPAEEILRPYHEAVCAAVDVWEGDAEEMARMTEVAAKLAQKHLPQVKEALHKVAVKRLEDLPELKVDLGGYEKRLESSMDLTQLTKLMGEANTEGILIATFWDPVKAAWNFRVQVPMRELGAQTIGLRALRDNLAPPKTYVTKRDPEEPGIAVEAGDELCLVDLKYDERGYYLLKNLAFYTRKQTKEKSK